MNLEQILEKAAAFDELAALTKAANDSTEDDLDAAADEILQKAAAFDELMSQNESEYDLDSAADEILQKAAAFDELMSGGELTKEASYNSEIDEILQKAAAYDDFVLDQLADEVIEKAAAYDQLLEEAELEEAMQKAAAYDELMRNMYKEAGAWQKFKDLASFKGALKAHKAVKGSAKEIKKYQKEGLKATGLPISSKSKQMAVDEANRKIGRATTANEAAKYRRLKEGAKSVGMYAGGAGAIGLGASALSGKKKD